MRHPDEPVGRRSETDVGAFAAHSGAQRAYQPISERYELLALLGRGGMGSVHRAVERASGREVALKQLRFPERLHDRAALEAMFEREFRTLAELQHPRVIRVYDYGLDPGGPYYTMELLEGPSLAQCAPLPWREACALIHDVCSSLALLHSRRLMHRDVTPGNVRRTADGRAKLIDFGGMGVMGASLPLIGTPGFTAPEVLDRLTLDARTDLFSVGALLYFVLTGRPAYPARSFHEVRSSWLVPPPPPSSIVPDIPPQLDTLVESLLRLEAAERPRTAWEVMQPLAAWAGLARDEDIDASRVYLATPIMIGRDELLSDVRRQVRRAVRGRGRAVLFEGEPGSGRTRVLDAAVWTAQTQGAVIVRAGGRSAGKAAFGLLSQVTAQLLEAAPSLFQALSHELTELFERTGDQLRLRPIAVETPQERTRIQETFTRLWLTLAEQQPIALAVDDVDHVDAASGGWLATLADGLRRQRMLLLCSCEQRTDAANAAAEVIRKRSRCHVMQPLTAAEVERLMSSVFGEAAHVSLIADRIFRVAAGNPGASMVLARSLVERKLARYDGGAWILPAQLELSELPKTIDHAYISRVASLSPAGRRLGTYHALSRYGALSHAEQEFLFEQDGTAALGQARGELLVSGALQADSANSAIAIASEAWRRALSQATPPAEMRLLHSRLGELGVSTGKPIVATAHHFFAGELADRGLDTLLQLVAKDTDRNELLMTAQLPLPDMARLFARAVDAALQHARRPRDVVELRRWLCMISSIDDTVSFRDASTPWLDALKRDSGLQDWLELADSPDAGARLTQALTRASQRYAALPEEARTYRVDEAIRHLVGYTVNAIAFGTRTCDPTLTRTLPGLLEPFAPISPLVDVMLGNCKAACEVAAQGHYFQARELWLGVYERLQNIKGDSLRYAPMIRSAIAFGIGCLEAALGMASAETWAEPMEAAPLTFIDSLFLRRVVRLAAGDFEQAERYARRAELRAVQTGARPVFSAVHTLEISVYTLAGDIAALRPVLDKVRALAEKHAGWRVHLECAQGGLHFLCGDYPAAEQSLSRALSLCTPDPSQPHRSVSPFGLVAGTYANVLLALERYADARAFAQQSLQLMAAYDIRTSDMVERALALAEAKLGDCPGAVKRLDDLIERQRGLGVSGLMLGVSFEARALIAIWSDDAHALRTYAKLMVAGQQRMAGSALGRRYLQLLAEARRAGLEAELGPAERPLEAAADLSPATLRSLASSRLRGARTTQQRAAAALQVICETAQAGSGHLYLIMPEGDLAFAASYHADAPGDAELSQAVECLQRAQSEASLTTQFMSQTAHVSAPNAWAAPDAGAAQCMLITGTRAHEARHVAVVLLRESQAARRVRGTLAVIGDLLLVEDQDLGVIAND